MKNELIIIRHIVYVFGKVDLTLAKKHYRIKNMEHIEIGKLILPAITALVFSVVPFLWIYFASPFVTVVHEYGHVITNILTLGRPSGIRVRFADGGGEAHSLRMGGFLSGIGSVFSLLSGYPAPILFGLGLIASTNGSHNGIFLSVSAIVFSVFVLLMRNFAGWLIGGAFAALFIVAANAPALSVPISYWLGAFFVVAGITDFIRLIIYYISGISEESDLGILAENHMLPQFIWLALMAGEIVFFGWLLIGLM